MPGLHMLKVCNHVRISLTGVGQGLSSSRSRLPLINGRLGLSTSYGKVQHYFNKPLISVNHVRLCSGQSQPNVNHSIKNSKIDSEMNLESELYNIDFYLQLKGYVIKRRLDNIAILLEKLDASEVSPAQMLFILRCCSSSVNLETIEVRQKMVSQFWDIFQRKKFVLDISHYNVLLEVFLENEYKFSPTEILELLQENNIIPNRITYSKLITKFCQEGGIEGATKIIEFMKEKQMPVSEGIFNSLIMGHSRANDMNGASNIIEVMKQNGLMPTSQTYAALLNAHAEHSDTEGISKLFSICEKEEINLSEKELLKLLNICVGKNLTTTVDEILPYIKVHPKASLSFMQTTKNLIVTGHSDLAYKLVEMSFQGLTNVNYGRRFFIKQLIEASDLNVNKVIGYCKDFVEKNHNIVAFEDALEAYLVKKDSYSALCVMKAMNDNRIELKQHYFYPLFCNAAENPNFRNQDIYDILETMKKYGIPIDITCVSTFIIPSLKLSDNIDALVNAYFSLNKYINNRAELYNGFVKYIFSLPIDQNLELATQFVKKVPRMLKWLFAPILVSNYTKPKQAENVVAVARMMVPYNFATMDLQNETELYKLEGIYRFVKSLFVAGEDKDLDSYLMPVLKEMKNNITPLPALYVEKLIKNFDAGMNSEIKDILHYLSNLTQIQKTFKYSESYSKPFNFLTRDDYVTQRKDLIDNEEKLMSQIKEDGFDMPINAKTRLLIMYLEEQRVDDAERLINEIHEEYSGFQIKARTVVKFAHLLVKNQRFQDAIRYLLINSPEDGKWSSDLEPKSDDYNHENGIQNMLYVIVKAKDLASLKLMQETLIRRNYARPSAVFRHLIEYYLNEDDLELALENFENIIEEYKVIANRRNLIMTCIEKEDSAKLQRIMEACAKIYGKHRSIAGLAFCFLEQGKMKQATKLFGAADPSRIGQLLMHQAEYYFKNEKIQLIEDLITAVKDIPFNHSQIYHLLMKTHLMQNDPEKALGVWLTMQENDIDASDQFLGDLGTFLQARNMSVPFVMPHIKQTEIFTPRIQEQSELVNLARNYLETGEIEAENLGKIRQIPQHLLKDLTIKLAEKDDLPALMTFYKYLFKCDQGAELFESLILTYDDAGAIDRFLSKFIDYYRAHREDMIEIKFPKNVLNIISAKVENISLLKEWSTTINEEQKIILLENTFNHCVIKGMKTEAEEIFANYLKDMDKELYLGHVLNNAIDKRDLEMVESLRSIVAEDAIKNSPKILERINVVHASILVRQNKIQECLDYLATQDAAIIPSQNSKTIVALLEKAKEQGITVPPNLQILSKTDDSVSSSSSSSSDSSSDEDSSPKKEN